MMRHQGFRERDFYADGWLTWLLVPLVALIIVLVLATIAAGATAYYSFTGAFTNGTETQSFLFNLNSALRPPAPFTLQTWHYGGGTNAAGDTIVAGGFDPILRLYNDTSALIAENDDFNPPTVRDSLIDWSTSGMPMQLAADGYQLNLVAYNNTLGGRTGDWAVDLVSDAAKFTLTGVDKNDGTGATTINSLTLGSDDVRLPAKVQIAPLESLSLVGQLIVGDTGAGDVTVTTGALTTNTGGLGLPILGNEPGSVGTVTLKQGGSWLDTMAMIQLGMEGTGNLVIESGGIASFNNVVVLAEFPSGEGNLTVRGLDSILVTNELLSVGDSGMGYVRIEDRGRIQTMGDFYGGGDLVGAWSQGRGIVEVDGKDSLWSSSTFIVGNLGQGTVDITNGGKIAVTHNAYIGRDSPSHDNSVTLTGAAPDSTPATWQVNGNLYLAGNEFNSSNAANSKLTINPGGLVGVAGTTTVWNGGGILELLGGELETGSLLVKPGATFTHTDGTLTVDGGTFDPGTGATDYVITGSDSADRPKVILSNGADSVPLGLLIVGRGNHGELAIEGGSTLTTTNVQTALAVSAAASSGKITVRGAQSQLIITDPAIPGVSHFSLMVGTTAPGELSISNGGQVKVQQGGASLACCLGWGFGTGAITVEGSDSLLEAKFVDFRATGGDTSVTIRDYGIVRTTDSSYYNLIAPLSHIASPTTVRVNITSGGRLELAGQLDIGGGSGVSGGSVHVSIDGSTAGQAGLSVNGPLSIGKSTSFGFGPASFAVANGGIVSASTVTVWQPGTVELTNGSVSTGSFELEGGTLVGNGTVTVGSQVTNAGVVSPGLSAGALSINGNYVQEAAGTLDIEIGGTSDTQFDRLLVGGAATLHGTLQVSLIDPLGGANVYEPQSGDSFKFLTTAGGLDSATFDNYLWPTLPGGLYFGALYDYDDSSVSLKVVGVLGDYNRNGTVDAADYIVWRKTYSGPNVQPISLMADGDGDGDVDDNDFGVWRTHFGQSAPPLFPGAGSTFNAIPEPASLWLALVALALVGWVVRPRQPICLAIRMGSPQRANPSYVTTVARRWTRTPGSGERSYRRRFGDSMGSRAAGEPILRGSFFCETTV